MRNSAAVALVLALSVPVVYAPIASGHFTLSRNFSSADPSRPHRSGELPVWDPTATALQDEPWLHAVRENLRRGRVAFVNLQNGLGAPLLETLQPGALYLLNPLLLLTFGDGPGFFDFFCLAHVALLVFGLYALLRCYARAEIAVAVAVLVGFSGATYHNVNMVHFRGYAWLPWMLAGAVWVARGTRTLSGGAILIGSIIGSATAGNLQDFVMSALVVAMIGGMEAAQRERGERAIAAISVALGLAVAVAISAPAFAPYFVSMAQGNLASVGTAPRCIASTPLDFFSSWILPRAQGTSTLRFQLPVPIDQQPDFTTPGFLLLCVGAAVLGSRSGVRRRDRALLAGLFAVLVLFLLKIVNVWPMQHCAALPFVRGIRFTKYCLQEAVVAGMILAIAAEHATRLDPPERRRLLRWALVPFVAALCALAWFMAGSGRWHLVGTGTAELEALLISWCASAAAAVAVIALVFLRQRPAWAATTAVFVVHAALVLPTGYFRPRPARVLTTEALRDPARTAGHRIASRMAANTNLFFGFEELGVFDAVLNRAFQRFATGTFDVFNDGFHLQFEPRMEAMTADRIAALRLVGVDLVELGPEATTPFRPTGSPELWALDGALPRAYLVDAAVASRADAHCAAGTLPDAVSVLADGARGGPALRELPGANEVVVENQGGGATGVLVLTRAYTDAWRLDGAAPRPLCGILSTWDVSLSAGERVTIRYEPPGLRLALRVAAGGALAAAAYLMAMRRVRRRA